ncbi:MAG: bifunctional alpha/beta hydrolase/class I SAM-dependent methyltransferase [Alphaproteobacteria bacterium]|nr:bifunctional alpha/beta hydrolase/class I SAM-dependent methyltransferase [Alphaproteobacteria bacterium]
MRESEFVSHDGEKLFFRAWPARSGTAKGAVVLLHRGHEHSGRVAHLEGELGLEDYAFFAWDARGNGRSPGIRGAAPSFACLVRDLDCFVRHICDSEGFKIEQIALVAQSVGAVIAASWVHDYAPKIRALVLASPAFDVRLYIPFARQGIALWQKFKGTFFVNSYVKARFLTHDPERISSFETDPLITRPIASNILLELHETAARVVSDARAITVPTQVLISGRDFVVRHEPEHRFFENLGGTIKERHVLPGFFHDTLGEKDRALALTKLRSFIEARFAEPPVVADVTHADLSGYTRDEADHLSTPLSLTSLRGLYWGVMRASIHIGGLFARGLRTGVRTGFDSGSTLDYVYENAPRGLGPVGRLIDRVFLDAIGWRGIRLRKEHLEELINAALTRLEGEGKPRHLLDIAAGHGRYVLDAVKNAKVTVDSIRLQDFSSINVDRGQALIAERQLEAVATFQKGDSFDTEALAAITPAPTLGIISGFYELFAENSLIRASLAGVARCMEPGSLLIYTGQPWHPQLEMIGRCLNSHRDGKPWVMRRRTQQEMDQLVEAAGFRKIEQRIDDFGIFTVSLAERI